MICFIYAFDQHDGYYGRYITEYMGYPFIIEPEYKMFIIVIVKVRQALFWSQIAHPGSYFTPLSAVTN